MRYLTESLGVVDERPGLTPLSVIAQGDLGQGGLDARARAGEDMPVQVGAVTSDVVVVAAADLRSFRREHYGKLVLGVLGTVLGAVLAILRPDLLPMSMAITSGSLLFTGGEVLAHVRAGGRLVVGPQSPTPT